MKSDANKTKSQLIAEIVKLRDRLEMQDEMMQNASSIMAILDTAGKIVYTPAGFTSVLGYGPEVANGMNVFDLVHPDDLKEAGDHFSRLIEVPGGEERMDELRFKGSDGSWRVLEASGRNLVHGSAAGRIVVNGRDITERKFAEEEIGILAGLLDTSPASITVHDYSGNFLYANQKTFDLHGFTREEFMSLNLHDIDIPESEALIVTRIKDMMRTGEASFDVKHFRKDGSVIPLHVSAKIARWHGMDVLLSVAADISERIKAEDALRESEERFRTVVNSMDDVIYTLDSSGRHTGIWGRWMDASGVTEGRFLGKTADEVLGEGAGAVHAEANMQALKGSKVVYEWALPGQEGNEHYQTSLSPLMDSDGSVTGIVGVGRNITYLIKAEDDMKKALYEKETLLRELYHRTKNNMQVICSLLDLQAENEGNERIVSAFRDMGNRIRSMALVHQKLYGSQSLSKINLAEYIEDLAGILFSNFRISPSDVKLDVRGEDVQVTIDIAIPCGLIVNELVSNALKHAFPAGRKGEVRISMNIESGGEIVIEVADNGVGLPGGTDFRKAESLGMHLVLTLVEQQLRGTIETDGSEGVRHSIRFRADSYKERIV